MAKRDGTPSFNNDFILIAEFCEQRGPVPLLVFPPRGSDKFDLNKFVVRILTSDHTRKVDPRGVSPGWYNPEDTQLYLTDSQQGAHAYVHHLTLHDLQARGYVRPVCICYVTNEPEKIMSNFEPLLLGFTQVSHLLKFGNNHIFVSNVYTHLKYLKTEVLHLSVEEQANAPALDFQGTRFEIEEMHNFPDLVADNYAAVTQVAEDLHELETRFQIHLTPEQALTKPIIDAFKSISFHCNEETSYSANFVSNSTDSSTVKLICHYLKQCGISSTFIELFEKGLGISSKKLLELMPQILKCVHKSHNFDAKLRPITEICGKLYSVASLILHSILEHFCRPNIVLEMEKNDLDVLSFHDNASLLFVGKSFLMDFNLHQMQKTYQRTKIHPGGSDNAKPLSPRLKEQLLQNISVADLAISPQNSEVYDEGNDDDYHDPFEDGYDETEKDAINQTKENDEVSDMVSASTSLTFMVNNLLFKNASRGSYVTNIFPHPTVMTSLPIPGNNLLKFKTNFAPLAKELAYSLLIGRMVVIHAMPENEYHVRELVNTLSIFVPGKWWESCEKNQSPIVGKNEENDTDGCICYWRTKPVTLKELSSLKLVGLSKKVNIPRSLENLISKYDFEKATLCAPHYKGEFLERMFSPKKRWLDDETYLAYVHSLFLEYALVASLCHHLHVVAIGRLPEAPKQQHPQLQYIHPRSRSVSSSSVPGSNVSPVSEHHQLLGMVSLNQGSVNQQHHISNMYHRNQQLLDASQLVSPSPFGDIYALFSVIENFPYAPIFIMKQLGLNNSDISIAQHWIEIAKEQQEYSMLNVLPYTVRLDLSKLGMFKKRKT